MKKLLALLGLLSAGLSADELKGKLVKVEASAVHVKDAAGKVHPFQRMTPKELPADLKPGQWVLVQYQPMKVAVRTPQGGRACVDCNRLDSIQRTSP